MRDPPQARAREQEIAERKDDHRLQTFWQWFAIGVLIFCWIAEATLCAQRGF